MKKTFNIGFIGGGNMAQAIIAGIISNNILKPQKISVFDILSEKRNSLKEKYRINISDSIDELLKMSEMIILAVKPNVLLKILTELKENTGNKPVISIAAGWSSAKIKSVLGGDNKVLRIMPNTPLMVGEGMSVFEHPSNLKPDEIAFAETIFSAMGQIEKQPAALMDAITAISGSGPAYVYIFIDALVKGAVLQGLDKKTALKLVTQNVIGAAKMITKTKKGPEELTNDVCSPGGTTIEAVKILKDRKFSDIVIEAVKKCTEKSIKLS